MQQIKGTSLLVNILTGILLLSTYSCSQEKPEREVRSVTDEEAEQYSEKLAGELSPYLAEGLDITLWASEKLVSDPVALDVDDQGRILVTNTARRRTSEIDIRGHRDWMIESAGFESVEDRRSFLHRQLASEKSEENSWLDDHNKDGTRDWHDLTVKKESVFRLADTSGNGHANRAELFVRDFHTEVTDVAGAVLHHEGDVFVGVAPDMWRIGDADGDGYGEEKESISHGYGVNIGFGGHGMSGLTVGPAGRIYWAIGDRGISVTDKEGNKWHHPREGVIVRAEPDGSNFEVFARGLRNTHEFVFDKYGNLIGVDNDGDHAGEHERLVYLVNGSDSGWRLNWQFGKYNDPKNNDYKVLMEEGYYRTRFEGQAAHLLPPLARYHNGPAGMAYNPGTALGEQWKDHFFVAEFVGSPTRSGIHAFTLKPSGASFELDTDRQIMQGLLATGLDFGPDGALYFADWIEGWALNQQGRIWKLDAPSDAGSSMRIETQKLLAGDFSNRTGDQLLRLLGHADMRVRQKAQFELAGRDETGTLEEALDTDNEQLIRVHGIWGLAQIARHNPEAADPLAALLKDSDAEIRAQAAKMLGDIRYEQAAEALIPLLKDEHPRVRFFATEALGRLSWQPAFDPIVDMLQANNDRDVYLRHGGAIALARIGDGDALTELSDHPSRAVRIAAVVALRRLGHPGITRFLDDEDEYIVTNAARAINDDRFIREGLEALAKMTEQRRFTNEPLLRRAINANLYVGTGEAVHRLAEFALRKDISEPLGVEALRTLSVWEESSELDRVTGDPRGKVENDPEEARRALAPLATDILSDENQELRIAGLEAISQLQFEPAVSEMMTLISEDPSPEVRIAALESLVKMEYENIEGAVFTALEDEQASVRMHALQIIPELNVPKENIVALIEPVLEHGTTEERQVAISTLGELESSDAYSLLEYYMQRLMERELKPEMELELIRAVESAESPSLKQKLEAYRQEKASGDSVSVYRALLYGGDAEVGRRIFYRNESAQCMRCHTIGGEGSQVGPDLSSAGKQLSREELLRALVDPGARIAPGFGSVTLKLHNGETVRGTLQEETEELITVAGNDGETVIDKTNIAERTNSPSGMPAMGEVLTRGELRDLVEFLTTLRDSGE